MRVHRWVDTGLHTALGRRFVRPIRTIDSILINRSPVPVKKPNRASGRHRQLQSRAGARVCSATAVARRAGTRFITTARDILFASDRGTRAQLQELFFTAYLNRALKSFGGTNTVATGRARVLPVAAAHPGEPLRANPWAIPDDRVKIIFIGPLLPRSKSSSQFLRVKPGFPVSQ